MPGQGLERLGVANVARRLVAALVVASGGQIVEQAHQLGGFSGSKGCYRL